jgi:hypothetical protein
VGKDICKNRGLNSDFANTFPFLSIRPAGGWSYESRKKGKLCRTPQLQKKSKPEYVRTRWPLEFTNTAIFI